MVESRFPLTQEVKLLQLLASRRDSLPNWAYELLAPWVVLTCPAWIECGHGRQTCALPKNHGSYHRSKPPGKEISDIVWNVGDEPS
jgi:hypothetical protein